MQILEDIWEKVCIGYSYYSGFIHSIFPSQLGDLVEYCLDIAIACLIIKAVASAAFHTKGGND